MRTDWRRGVLSLAFLTCSSACGGDPALGLSLSTRGLSAVPAGLRVVAFESAPPCQVVWATGPQVTGVRELIYDLGASRERYEIPELQAGAYTIVVWALDDSNGTFGFGCASDVRVRDGEATEVIVVLEDYER